MSQRSICILLTTVAVCYALTTKSEFITAPEFPKNEPNGDKLLSSIVRSRNSSRVPYLKSNDSDAYDRNSDKLARTTIHRPESETRDKSKICLNCLHIRNVRVTKKLKRASSSCCGSKYGSNASTRPDSYHSKIPADSDRYPYQYGERLPVDRYGWQAQGQPPGSSGNPGSGNHDAPAPYEGNRFSSRPSYGSESSRRPNGYEYATSGGYGYGNGGYGGYGSGRPTGYGGSPASGGYGISGTLASGDEFGGAEPNYGEGNGAPPHPNLQAQKAVALKALAGVALIGAAAALATNPILLPIGIISGRKKRSYLSVKDEDAHMNYILKELKSNFTKVDSNGSGKKMLVSPTCIARISCEIQKKYWSDPIKEIKGKTKSEHRFTDLTSNNILDKEIMSARMRKIMKTATTVAMNGGNCNVFTCTFLTTVDPKKQFILKL